MDIRNTRLRFCGVWIEYQILYYGTTAFRCSKTSAYYSIAPFLGVAFSMVLLGERPTMQFYIAMIIMIASTAVMVKDTISLENIHEDESP